MFKKTYFTLVILLVTVLVFPNESYAVAGVPNIISYQGRLADASGTPLGGDGTFYCFRFSMYDSASGVAGKVWPTQSPSAMLVKVIDGVFNVGIGDTVGGGDLLDYDFQSNDSVYLNVDVANTVDGSCVNASFESLVPRERIYATGYAINARSVGGFVASQSATGNQIPVLTSGRLILGGTNVAITASGANILTLQNGSSGDINFFNSNNFLSSSGNLKVAGSVNGLGLSSLDDGFAIRGGTQARALTVTGGDKMIRGNGMMLNFDGDISFEGGFSTTGNHGINLIASDETNITLPSSGTLATTEGVETFINKSVGSGGLYFNAGSSIVHAKGVGSTNISLTVGIGGVSAGQVIKIDSLGRAVGTSVSDTNAAIGVSIFDMEEGGTAQIAIQGIVNAVADTDVMAGDYIGVGTITSGRAKSFGSQYPTVVGAQVIGRALSSATPGSQFELLLEGLDNAIATAGGSTALNIVQGSDQSVVNSTVLADSNTLSFPVGAGETWVFQYSLLVSNNNSSIPAFKAAINGEDGWSCSVTMSGSKPAGGSLAQVNSTNCGSNPDTLTISSVPGSGIPYNVTIQGVVNATSAGSITLQFAENTASAGTSITIKAGSFVQAQRVLGADIAEMYYSKDMSIEAGDVVALDSSILAGVQKTSTPYDRQIFGIVSTRPGIVLGESMNGVTGMPVVLALAGRVPVKVNLEGGEIDAGDMLTSSSVPGVAMKAVNSGRVIGIAMSSYNKIQSEQDAKEDKIGTVMVFVNNHWFGGSVDLNATSTMISSHGTLFSRVNDWLDRGIASLEKMFVRELSAVNAVFTTIKTNTIEVIDGLQMVDKATGLPYCTWIEDGQWVKRQMRCGSAGVSAVGNDIIESSVNSVSAIKIDEAVATSTQATINDHITNIVASTTGAVSDSATVINTNTSALTDVSDTNSAVSSIGDEVGKTDAPVSDTSDTSTVSSANDVNVADVSVANTSSESSVSDNQAPTVENTVSSTDTI